MKPGDWTELAMGWLEVAADALEQAERLRAKGMAARDERYERAREALVARYREDKAWLRIERAIKAKLREERAGKAEKGRAA